MLVLLILREKPPLRNVHSIHFRLGGRVSFKDGVLHLPPLILHGNIAESQVEILIAQLRRHGDDMGLLGQCHYVVHGQLLAGQHFRSWAHIDHGEAKYPVHIGSEGSDEIFNVLIQPVDKGRERDHRRHADYDSQDREARAHLIAAQRFHRHSNGFKRPTGAQKFPHSSDLRATMGSSMAALRAG